MLCLHLGTIKTNQNYLVANFGTTLNAVIWRCIFELILCIIEATFSHNMFQGIF